MAPSFSISFVIKTVHCTLIHMEDLWIDFHFTLFYSSTIGNALKALAKFGALEF